MSHLFWLEFRELPAVQKALQDAQAKVEALSGDLQTAVAAQKKLQVHVLGHLLAAGLCPLRLSCIAWPTCPCLASLISHHPAGVP